MNSSPGQRIETNPLFVFEAGVGFFARAVNQQVEVGPQVGDLNEDRKDGLTDTEEQPQSGTLGGFEEQGSHN